MTNTEKLAYVKTMLNIDDDSLDAKLTAYLDMAEKEIVAWLYSLVSRPANPHVPEKYDIVQINAVVVAYSIEGAEGEVTHHENGINRKFNYDTMVKFIRSHVYPYAGV